MSRRARWVVFMRPAAPMGRERKELTRKERGRKESWAGRAGARRAGAPAVKIILKLRTMRIGLVQISPCGNSQIPETTDRNSPNSNMARWSWGVARNVDNVAIFNQIIISKGGRLRVARTN